MVFRGIYRNSITISFGCNQAGQPHKRQGISRPRQPAFPISVITVGYPPSPQLNGMDLSGSILKTLLYFDLFHYPVSKEELSLFLDVPCKEADLEEGLQQLHDNQQIYLFDSFYCLHDDPALISKRNKDNLRAEKLLKKAVRISRFLFQFPFVRAVGISGSLSKNVADEQADIDYFIITAPNRLWIARTLLHLYKKLTFLTKRQHHYCMNYFIDQEAYKIQEQNVYTAMELVTLLPVCGNPVLQQFYKANNWSRWFFPNLNPKERVTHNNYNSPLKRLTEFLLSNKYSNRLDNYLLTLTDKRWSKKVVEGKTNSKGKPMALCCGKHFARPNPALLQQTILQSYRKRMHLMGIEDITVEAAFAKM